MTALYVILAIGICVEACLLGLVISGERPKPPPKAQVLIVLGARIRDGKPTRTLQRRLDAAILAHHDGLGEYILVSGGKCFNDDVPEAQVMAQALYDAGIDKRRVLLETNSCRTSENLRESFGMMRKLGYGSATVVTSEYHIFRTMWQAKSQGIQMHAIAAQTPSPMIWYGRFRETVAVVKFLLLRT